MKKLILSLLITGTLILPLGDFIVDAYCMSLEATEEVEIGLSKFKLPIFMEYDFSETYAGFLLTLVDYKNWLYGDIGMMSNAANEYASIGISMNMETACSKIGINYKLPAPIAIGMSFGRALYDSKNIVVFYIGLVGEFDK